MPVRVGMGLGRFAFDDVNQFRAWLDLCEAGLIDSVWQSDRVQSTEPFHEPLALLAVVAGATKRLKIGTNAVVLGFRDPVTFARQCAAIDHLSEGRLLLVVGVGRGDSTAWNATGRSARGRGAAANEALEILTRLWTAGDDSGEQASEGVTVTGEHHRVENARISPLPVQQPLPLWIGGSSEAAIRRTVRFGTGWLAGLQDVEGAVRTAAAIRTEARAQGKRIPADHYGATILYRIQSAAASAQSIEAPLGGAAHLVVSGEPEVVIERLRTYVAGGISKFVAIPMARNADEWMEQTRLLERDVLPEAHAMPLPKL